jgi:tetratricopeptide (TPR) repeat protein
VPGPLVQERKPVSAYIAENPLEESLAKPQPPEIPPLRPAAIVFIQPSLRSSTDGFSSAPEWRRQQLEIANHDVLELMNLHLLQPSDIAVEQKGSLPVLLVPMEKLMPHLMAKISQMSGWSGEQMLQMAQGTPEQVGELLTGLVDALRSMSQYEEGKEAVLTPQELTAAMLVFRMKMEPAGGDPTKQQTLAVRAPTASCAEYSLLFVELLEHLKLKPSILSLHPMDQSGLPMTGHSTACIEVSGFLVDAAMGQVYPLGKIPAEGCGPEYDEFQEQIKSLYDDSINKAQKNMEGWPPSKVRRYDFQWCRTEKEFLGLFYLGNWKRPDKEKMAPEDKRLYEDEILEAQKLNPGDPKAAQSAAMVYRERGDYKKTTEIYRQAAELNPESYFTTYYAARGMMNVYNNEKERVMAEISLEDIQRYADNARRLDPDSAVVIVAWVEIMKKGIERKTTVKQKEIRDEIGQVCRGFLERNPDTLYQEFMRKQIKGTE